MNYMPVVCLRSMDSAYKHRQTHGMSSNADNLRRYVLARREELEMTQLEVWQAGGPSNTTLTIIEKGEMETLTRTTARKLDTALRWVPGSAKAAFEKGEEPVPAVAGLGAKDARWLADQIKAAAEVDAETREKMLRFLDAQRGSA